MGVKMLVAVSNRTILEERWTDKEYNVSPKAKHKHANIKKKKVDSILIYNFYSLLGSIIISTDKC